MYDAIVISDLHLGARSARASNWCDSSTIKDECDRHPRADSQRRRVRFLGFPPVEEEPLEGALDHPRRFPIT